MATVRGLEQRCSFGGRLAHPSHCMLAVARCLGECSLNFMLLVLFAVPLAAAYREFTETHAPNRSLKR